jgi:hypothetical protein
MLCIDFLKKCAKKRKIEHFFELKNAVFSRKIASFLRKNQKITFAKSIGKMV